MIVVDTNVIAYLWIPGIFTLQAEKLLKKDPEWVVPFLWRSELRNVLSVYVQNEKMDVSTAYEIMQEAEKFFLGKEYHVSSDHVLTLAAHSKCSAYDCEFVALAEDLEISLVTNDRQILKKFSLALSLEDSIL